MSSKGRIYRRNTHRLVFAGAYVALGGGIAVLAYVVHPAFAVVTVVLLVLAWRTYRIGVVAADDGVTVRNVGRDRHIPWVRVARFDWGTWWGFPIGGVWLDDGRFVRSFALNPPFEIKRGQNKAVPRALDGLNAELTRVRGDGTVPPS